MSTNKKIFCNKKSNYNRSDQNLVDTAKYLLKQLSSDVHAVTSDMIKSDKVSRQQPSLSWKQRLILMGRNCQESHAYQKAHSFSILHCYLMHPIYRYKLPVILFFSGIVRYSFLLFHTIILSGIHLCTFQHVRQCIDKYCFVDILDFK